MKIDYNYHTHTKRCGHAEGEDEEYVINAIKFGLKDLGFSDHCILPHIVQPGMRGAWNLLDDYLNSIKNLKEKYKDQINIYTGFECEWMPQYKEYYTSLLKEHKVDYLILGQHCHFEGRYCMWYVHMEREQALREYTKYLIEGIKSGLFLYVAHPDLFMLLTDQFGDLERKYAQQIIDAAIEQDIPLEINLCHARLYGMRHFAGCYSYYQYPFTPFWEMVAKTKAKVVIGFDSHLPKDVYKPGVEIYEHIVNTTGVKPIYHLSLKDKEFKI